MPYVWLTIEVSSIVHLKPIFSPPFSHKILPPLPLSYGVISKIVTTWCFGKSLATDMMQVRQIKPAHIAGIWGLTTNDIDTIIN